MSPLVALQSPAYRWQLGAQATSMLGDAVTPLALAFGMVQTGRSSADLGIVLAAQAVPLLVFMLLGGVWADRLPRYSVMMTADLVRMFCQGGLAALFITDQVSLTAVVLLQVVNGTATAFFQPAAGGLTVLTVPTAHLQPANALLAGAAGLTGVTGPLLAGILVATVQPGWALALDSLTFLVSAACLSRLRRFGLSAPDPAARPASSSVWSDLMEGWRETRSRSWVWVSILAFMLSQLMFSAVLVLGVLVAERDLGGAPAWAAILAAISVGDLLGSAAAAWLRPARLLFAARMFELLFLPLLLLLAVRAPLPALLVAGVATGFAFSFADTLWYTALQQHVPGHALSRVISYDHLGSQALRPVGYAGAGLAAGVVGDRALLIGGAVVLAAVMAASLLVTDIRRLRRVDEVPVAEPSPTGGPA
jgi:hypothetical protein